VTHDFEEAISMGQRIAVLADGKIQQVGAPEQIFRKPETEFIARFTMAKNIFNGEVFHNDAGQAVFEIDGLHFQVDSIADGNYHAVIRPEDVLISNEPADGPRYNCFYGKVLRIIDKGSVLLVTICLPPDIQCLVTRHMFDELELATGNNVYVSFKKSSAHLFK
jgi:ABC-type Fe3+/spermidine/putrescine transport system ATPase subunit